MKLPRTIKAGPLTYTVVEDDAYLDNVGPDDEKTDGLCQPNREQITLRAAVSDGMKRVVLFHETLHIAWDLGSLPGENEESVIEGLDSPLLAVLDDNPALRRALWGEKN